MSAYSVSSLSPSHSRQVLSAPCSPLVVVFPALGLGSGSLGTWVDCIIQVPFFRSNANQQNIHSGILSSSPASSCSIAGHVIPETSGQGFCEAVFRDAHCLPYLAVPGTDSVIADRLFRPYLSPRPTRLSTCSTCCHYRVGPSHASAQPHRPTGLSFALLAFSASTLVSEGCNTSSILWRKGGFCQIWENPNVVGLTRAAI